MKEYSHAYEPGGGQTPYYAILEPENRALYERYLERVQDLSNFHPVVVWRSTATTTSTP